MNIYKKVIMGIILVSIFLLIYAFEIEPNNVEITHTHIKINNSQNTCKLLVISDFHGDKELIDNAVKEMNLIIKREKIDAVIIDGDLIHYEEKEIISLEGLKNINPSEIYAVLGNHDYRSFSYGWKNKELADKVEKYLENLNIDVLRNENRMICEGNVILVGVDCIWTEQDDLKKAFNFKYEKGIEKSMPEILIAHNPDIIYKLNNESPDLIISGHTRGGQVKIPLIGIVYMPSEAGKICPEGLCEINGHKIYVTRGIAGRLRFLSRPEISVIELS